MHAITHANQIGAALQARRKELKLTQAEVAGRLGLSQNRLSELENEPASLTVEQLLALLNVLGLQAVIQVRNTRQKSEW